jgi:hypothetical protein
MMKLIYYTCHLQLKLTVMMDKKENTSITYRRAMAIIAVWCWFVKVMVWLNLFYQILLRCTRIIAPWYQDYSEELPPWESDPDFTYPPFVFFIVCINDKEFCIVLYIIDERYLKLRIALNKVRKLTAI